MVQQAITYTCFVNVTWLRVGYLEREVAAVSIGTLGKVAIKRENVIHQMQLELLYVCTGNLTPYKLLPCRKEVFNRDDIFISTLN